MESKNQIRQMVNFILQEAHEKANEIRIKTEHDFNIEKQMLVHNAKLAIAEEYKAKERAREVQERIARSTALGDARVTKMKQRDELLKTLIAEAKEKVAAVANTPQYTTLLKQLIIQGLIKIEEVAACQSVLASAVDTYKDIVKKATGEVLEPKVTINANAAKHLPDALCSGGVSLQACHGRIVCNNTVDARVALVYEETLPTIRQEIWPIPKVVRERVTKSKGH